MARKNFNAAPARNKDHDVARQQRRMLADERHNRYTSTMVAGPLSKNLVVTERVHEYR